MRTERVLAPNPGPFTGAGTNTWILDHGGSVVVIDPGPVIDSHLDAIGEAVADRIPVAVLVTHTHEDHAPLANPLARLLDVPALGHRPGPGFEPDDLLADDSVVEIGPGRLTVVYTPGHADDHLCFLTDRVLFTGDHVIGGSSVMVDDMSAYLASLRRVRDLDADRLLPGHGEEMEEPRTVVDWYIAHRLERERQIVAALEAGADDVESIVADVYADVDVSLHPLAARSVRAHLRKLADDGVVDVQWSPERTRAELVDRR